MRFKNRIDLLRIGNLLALEPARCCSGLDFVAEAGIEEGCDLVAGSCIVSPSGEIIAMASSKDDEVFGAKCDLGISRHNIGGDVQFRPASPHRALSADHRKGRRDSS